jgi:hypothetical protein
MMIVKSMRCSVKPSKVGHPLGVAICPMNLAKREFTNW